MNNYWIITPEDYINVVEISKELGIKPGESMEEVFLAYMEIKGQKPNFANEFTKEEFLQQLTEKGNKILDIETNKEGKTIYKFVKKSDANP